MPPFFASSEDDTHIYGRGCVDAKGQIAPQILAVRNLQSRGVISDGDVRYRPDAAGGRRCLCGRH